MEKKRGKWGRKRDICGRKRLKEKKGKWGRRGKKGENREERGK